MMDQGFETKSVRMERNLLMTILAPVEDVDRIMEAVVKISPLVMGKYDNNAYQTAAGTERYRPLEGAAAGPESDVRKRPGVVEIIFEVADDNSVAEQIVEAVFQVHSYQEPLIRMHPIFSSRSKGLDDTYNPNRWWNTTGDWKKNANPSKTI